MRRLVSGMTLLCLLVIPTMARPAPAPADKAGRPSVVVRVQPIDELLANARFLAELVGQEEQAKQFEGLIKSMVGPNGLDGIDTKRPLALYGNIGPNGIDSTAVAIIPVADEKALLDLLARLDVKAEKGKDGLYTVRNANLPVPVFFRFANKYAYVTAQDETAIDPAKLIAPEKVIGPNPTGVISTSINISDVPDVLRTTAIQQMEAQLEEAKKQRDPGETDTQHKFKVQMIDHVGAHMVSLLRDGDNVTLAVNIDRKAGDISLDFSLAGKKGSKLAGTISDLAKTKSVVAGIIGKNSIMNLSAYAVLPPELRKAMEPVLEEALKKSIEEEKDKAKREAAAKAIKVLSPTFKAAELDFAVDVRGPSAKGLYTIVGGVKIQNGADVEKAAREAIKDLPAEERAKIKLDADQVGAVKIHRLDAQKEYTEDARKALGDTPVYYAFRSDAMLVALGENGLAAMKEAIVAGSKPATPLRLEMSVARLIKAAPDQDKNIAKIAAEAFGKGQNNDTIRLAVEGGDTLRLSMGVKAPVIKVLAKIAEARAAAGQ